MIAIAIFFHVQDFSVDFLGLRNLDIGHRAAIAFISRRLSISAIKFDAPETWTISVENCKMYSI